MKMIILQKTVFKMDENFQMSFCVKYIYNIGVLTVNIEFMWRGLETG